MPTLARRVLASLVLSLVISPVPRLAAAPTPPLWGSLTAGRYEVGFRRIWTTDPTRVWEHGASLDSLDGSIERPLRIDVWYPATGEHTPMPLRNYLEMPSPAPAFDALVSQTHVLDAWSYHNLAGEDSLYARLMATPTAASFEAPPAQGHHPLILYSAGWFNRAPDNTVLMEFLAGHGYVVASVPQLNPGLWTYDFHSDAASVENQVRDLEAALGELVDEPEVDRTRVAAMGYSTGGDVALLLADRNALVDAVIGLDASWSLSDEEDVSSSALFRPQGHTEPILVLRRPLDDDAPGGSVLMRVTGAPRVVVQIPGATHGSFSDDPPEFAIVGREPEGSATAHVAIARATLEFLEAVFPSPGTFDGARLADRYRRQGLDAAYLPRSTPTEGDD
jgi:dienelactone hydrolase